MTLSPSLRAQRSNLLGDCFVATLLAMTYISTAFAADTITIGSKKFTEGYILSEIFAQAIAANTPYQVERQFGLGGTTVCFEALNTGAIDLYPEYTGTAQEVLLKSHDRVDATALDAALRTNLQMTIGPSLGFNNTYALAVRADTAEKNLHTISDARAHPDLRFGLSHEFLARADGWPAVATAYNLHPRSVVGLEHGLAYEALRDGVTDVIDAYSTDAKLARYHLTVLRDDQEFFPEYVAVPLVRVVTLEKFPELTTVFKQLANSITDDTMRAMNAAVEIDHQTFAHVAQDFLQSHHIVSTHATAPTQSSRAIPQLLAEHLSLTLIALFAAILVGIPGGILLTRAPHLAAPALAVVGVFQTIPSIALLAFMIPLVGIGTTPAIVALFLYGLLPIVRNTYVGLRDISFTLLEVADGLGLTRLQRLRLIELPLASRVILAGIKTCAVINIGTATLAAFIGAGGLGEPIVTGLALNDTRMILRGAIPAALLAIITEYGFTVLERCYIPKGLRTPRIA